MKLVSYLNIQKKRSECFPSIPLSNYYFHRWNESKLLILDEIDSELWYQILTNIWWSFIFISPLFLELWRNLVDDSKVKFVIENSLEYWWIVSNWNYSLDKELKDREGILQVLWFYKYLDTGPKESKVLIHEWLWRSWIDSSPILVNFEDRVIIWFFERWLKIMIFDEEKRVEIKEEYKKYLLD